LVSYTFLIFAALNNNRSAYEKDVSFIGWRTAVVKQLW